MKKVALITNVVILAIVFVACKQKGPEQVVEKFYTHFCRGEFKEVKEYVMEEHHSYYDLLGSFVAAQGNAEEKSEIKVTDIKCEIQDDVATCTCLVQEGNQEPKEQMLQLKKVNKNWLVNQGKEGAMPSDDAEDPVEEEETSEDLTEEE